LCDDNLKCNHYDEIKLQTNEEFLMFTKFEYSIFNYDSPFYQTGNEVAERSTSGKKSKVSNVKTTTTKFSFRKLFLRPKIA